jgi:TusE/DsrC/DsvC family sulfur relay protein
MNAQANASDPVLARLDALDARLAAMMERQRKQDELFDELRPMMSVMMREATRRLDAFEKRGHVEFVKELVKVGDRVLESYSADDVRQFGDAVIGILDTVRAMTQPEVLAVMGDAAELVAEPEKAEALGLVGMVRATGNSDVQRGMGVMMELLKKVGQGAAAAKRARQPKPRSAPRLPARAVAGGLAATAPRRAVAAAGPACATPKPPGPAAVVIDGVAFTADGHLADPAAWSRPLAERVAATLGVAMTEAHWRVVGFARADWEATKASPNIRRITTSIDVSTKELYALFPKAPARTVAKIAGTPKPAGCL